MSARYGVQRDPHLVIIDPSCTTSFLLGELLTNLPARVDTLESPEDLPEGLDVLLVPAVPVGTTIRALVQLVRSEHPELDILAYTNMSSPAVRVAALEAGVDGVLSLPVITPELHATVRALLRRSSRRTSDQEGATMPELLVVGSHDA